MDNIMCNFDPNQFGGFKMPKMPKIPKMPQFSGTSALSMWFDTTPMYLYAFFFLFFVFAYVYNLSPTTFWGLFGGFLGGMIIMLCFGMPIKHPYFQTAKWGFVIITIITLIVLTGISFARKL